MKKYKEPFVCPHCQADLRNLEAGPPFKREIRVKIRCKSVDYLQCPDCDEIIAKRNLEP